ncbi:MAG: twin-arginine translocation signal domain-containing protein [Verrucomicrobia bacterium]|nr:twin-arginine translocation signal domain-containing protein [Verrucomicrobiota bacterium]
MTKPHFNRRHFLKSTTAACAAAGAADLGFLNQLAPVSAAEAKLPTDHVRLDAGIEPLVRLLEETPRSRVIEEFASRVRRGTSYREVLAALLLAGVRNIQPRPVGFKFHAVLVVNSAHLASLNSPAADRWLPIFWALDQFKGSQARDEQEGDWTMAAVDEAAVPPAHRAKQAFITAMDNWDVSAADAAVAGLARTAGAHEIFELFARYGARDFRDIGHKAIYVANSWRTLENIGWQHAEPVLRSLAYALLEHEGSNPAQRDAAPDQPGRRNQPLVAKIRADWLAGKPDSGATTEMLRTLRQGNAAEAADKVVELLNRGVSSASVWDGIFAAAGELLMRQPAIVSLHSITASNAIHHAWQHSGSDDTRRWLLLQAASFLPMFRERMGKVKATPIDELPAVATEGSGAEAMEEIFAEAGRNKPAAARKTLGYLNAGGDALAFINTARRLIYLKGGDAHDYKFSEAALEDYFHVSPKWRDRYLAASTGWLRGSGGADNKLVQRTREAFKA